jgi:SAM-dependent methyltransferase
VQRFDNWYAAMATSSRRDALVQHHLGLPAYVLSGSLLPWDGIAEVVELLRLPPSATLLDLACGRGGYGLEVAARAGASLVGIDFSAEAIRQAGQCADTLGRPARFVVADIAETGLPTASVDGVMCIDAVHIAAEPDDVFAEIRRVLRPGGRAVVTCWEARDRENDILPEWVRRVDCAAWFAAAGFADIVVVERPAWERAERALFEAAAGLDPAGDDALVALRDEAIEVLPDLPHTRRVLASATAPPHRPRG